MLGNNDYGWTPKKSKSEATLAAPQGSAAGIRESKKWWAVEDTGVRQVTGYICSRDNRDLWWCPQAGYTLTVGHHLFETEKEALAKAIEETEFEISEAQKHLAQLKRQNNDSATK